MIDKMGEIVWALNEKNDSLIDLLSYTRSYAVEYLSQNGIHCTVNFPEHLPSSFVSGEFRQNIFLAVKEILHNVVKHSRANNVNIAIQLSHDMAIQIKDDGIGFDRTNIRPYSNGLTNIEKRMKDIGGVMEIQNSNGTTVNMRMPLPL
jgi:signal transduction histidine kinase